MRYFIHLCYDGTQYVGWQTQPNGVSIQAVLENGLTLLLREKIPLTGCGRTDAGVHAKDFYAHFDTLQSLDPAQCETLCMRLNGLLPQDIRIFRIFKVQETAHARFDAVARTYEYHLSLHKNPFLRAYTLNILQPLDFNKMNLAGHLITKHNDFTSFSKLHTQTKTNLCKVTSAEWQAVDKEHWMFVITADRFLRNMVRAIVGTLLMIGKGKLPPEEIEAIIEKKDRCAAGTSVPAKALFLSKVDYPKDITHNP